MRQDQIHIQHRTLDTLLDEYAQDHRNLINQKIHYVCVPLIVWSLLGLLWSIPLLPFSLGPHPINAGLLFVLGSLCYYLYLDFKSFLFMFSLSLVYLVTIIFLERFSWSIYVYFLTFVVAWLGQFVGHKIEGQKPSFLKDLHFLFIGPVWVFHKMKKSHK